ncbi:hypothetical protein GCM10010873_37420 [Cypionkella aquatica]|uniref:Uncharacterized protein n=1 Tax=Cypionkella aquatica TaxID=1756042 RepID=A0AA37TW63_9RHOB|nr:hypothetical protein [Cypionkella aquatica]GLS88768.1 hypothetical protein GCM10010873_37420 [Cypionkella aquatica]
MFSALTSAGLIFLLGILPPPRWGLRLAALIVMALAFIGLLSPTPYDPDWAYGFVCAALFWAVAIGGLAVPLAFLVGQSWPVWPLVSLVKGHGDWGCPVLLS